MVVEEEPVAFFFFLDGICVLIIGQIERKDLAAVETISAYQIIGREHAQT